MLWVYVHCQPLASPFRNAQPKAARFSFWGAADRSAMVSIQECFLQVFLLQHATAFFLMALVRLLGHHSALLPSEPKQG